LSAETFVEGYLNELASSDLRQIIPYIGNFRVLEKWRKIAGKPAPAFSDELRALLADSPSTGAKKGSNANYKDLTYSTEHSLRN